jgi:hypothetical protein
MVYFQLYLFQIISMYIKQPLGSLEYNIKVIKYIFIYTYMVYFHVI